MDIKQLRALLAVAETGSVTRAAGLLHIVQPAVSRHLKLLEEDVGAPLFDRGRYGMELTEAGDILVEYARRALFELDRARAEIKPAMGTVSGVATIGLLPSTANLLAGALISAAKMRYPGIRIRLTVGYAGHLQQWLESGEVDAALLYNPKALPAINARPLLEEQLYVVGPNDSSLEPSVAVSFAELAQWPMILPSAPHGIRSLLDQACLDSGVELDLVTETNSMDVQKALVMTGHGFTILPAIAVRDELTRGELKAAPLTKPDLRRQIALALPNTRRVTAPVRCATEILVEEMKSAVERGEWPAQWL
ncbi:LysR family transcriptional regulator [Paraburkholderia sp. UYCP14C]|uniref:LysR family transcriptional regulator n=1 Tax=Paraburkholderia sp. UYCP14C TaxID=2511130 RepID=UPI00101FBF56|nr:LysR substrate-binding domain-containing protein [Paraburkholderia sp. UYCP14C]RZF27912.1 LysR family transcriptional regulator [Paraburkholderia sp. UYCP14C]